MLTTCINWPNGTETFLVSCFRWLRVIGHHRPHSPLWLYLCLFHLLTKDFPSLTSWKMIFSDLAFCCHSTVFVIIETWVWKTLRVSDDYATGLLFRLIMFAGRKKIKNQSKQNKYADPGYWRTLYNCMGHTSSNNKTLNARLLARVITGCHYT